ncbi:MAG: zinc-binding dehydrogenase [Rhodovarius sp.]|nr:zinc-binding dehydrogenase [Rhodovarius sp.]MCX7933312.1 zinc-binding dehydrogenase [Rhodovarius sp.]MDW8314606.1 zinc-binding dehydrogenase [Rhodovarius sp.]
MRALRLFADRDLRLTEIPPPPPPREGEVRLRVLAVGLNHLDLWGFRGMAFAQRRLPITVGVEAVAEVLEAGPGVALRPGQRVVPYGALTCGQCPACRAGRDNFCEQVAGLRGFHLDGFAQEEVVVPARLCVPVPAGVAVEHAATAAVTFATVQHMLFDNARLEPGEVVLIHAAGSGIGSTAVRMAKAIGCTVIATVGSEEKRAPALALGADHVVVTATERFESVARRVTGKRGVDVVFEHVGPATWAGSLLSLRMGGRLVTCGSTSGVSAETNLMLLFQRQLRIIGSFGSPLRSVAEGLDKMAQGILPVIDRVLPLEDVAQGLARLESRQVFGKLVVRL